MTRLVLLLALLAGAASAVNAQVSVYATGGIANYGISHLQSDSYSFKGDVGSFGGGAFYNFPIQSRFTAGIDGRASFSPGAKGGFLAGGALRVGFVPYHFPLRPFLQVGGGVVHTTYDSTFAEYNSINSIPTLVVTRQAVTSGALQLIFGLDIRLSDHIDLRLPEYGAQAGGTGGFGTGVGFLHGGLVYHLRPS